MTVAFIKAYNSHSSNGDDIDTKTLVGCRRRREQGEEERRRDQLKDVGKERMEEISKKSEMEKREMIRKERMKEKTREKIDGMVRKKDKKN